MIVAHNTHLWVASGDDILANPNSRLDVTYPLCKLGNATNILLDKFRLITMYEMTTGSRNFNLHPVLFLSSHTSFVRHPCVNLISYFLHLMIRSPQVHKVNFESHGDLDIFQNYLGANS